MPPRSPFTSEDRVREVVHNFNADGFDPLAPKYTGGRPPKVILPERAAIKKIARGRPGDHGEPCAPSLPDLTGPVPAF
jgi:transposase